jgi:hypothetical protein
MEYFPGMTVAGESPETEEYRRRVAGSIDDPDAVTPGARGYTSAVLAGDYLNANPYREGMFRQGADQIREAYQRTIQPGVDTAFVGGGRGGSYAHRRATAGAQRGLGRELGNLWERIGYQDYRGERGVQEAAAGRAPMLDAATYSNLERLGGVGREEDVYSQRLLDDAIRRFEFGENEPWQRMGQYSSLIGAPVMTSQARAGGWSFGVGCWVSGEYFGLWTPSWWAARNWIMDGWQTPLGKAFRAVYVKHGERLAGLVRRNRIVRATLRPIFLWCRKKGCEQALANARIS